MTELEKAAKEWALRNVPSIYESQAKRAFIAGANYQKSLPDPSLEEIKERFKNFVIDKNWLVEPGFTVKRALDIFEFFTPFIKGDAVEFFLWTKGKVRFETYSNEWVYEDKYYSDIRDIYELFKEATKAGTGKQ